jgi:hypothetical protein
MCMKESMIVGKILVSFSALVEVYLCRDFLTISSMFSQKIIE